MNHHLIRSVVVGGWLLGCVAPGSARAQENGLSRPVISAVVIRPDTVWFCGTLHGSDSTSYYFVRQTRAWSRLASSSGAPCASVGRRIPAGDTVEAGQGIRILRVSPPHDANDIPLGRVYLRVVDSARGRTTDLLRQLDPAVIARLPRLGNVDQDSVSTGVSAVATDDSTLWIGLLSGFPDGAGAYGGVLRLDRRSGAVDWINDSLIVYRDITGLVAAGRWLLAAAVTEGEYGPYGDPGLLRYDRTTRRWRLYGDSTTLADRLIRTLADDGHLVAFATARGLAVADYRRDGTSPTGDDVLANWSGVRFIPAFVGDSMVFDVDSADRAPAMPEAEGPWLFAQRFAPVGRERFFYDAVSRLPAARLARSLDYGEDSVIVAVADTSLVPLLTRMLDRPETQRIAALALARLGSSAPTNLVGTLRRQFLDLNDNRPAVAKALFAFGDSMPRQWARAVLDTVVRTGAQGDLYGMVNDPAEILADLHDRLGLSLLIAVASVYANRTTSNFLTSRLAAFDDPAGWATILFLERAGKLRVFDVAMVLRPSALADSIVSVRVADFLRRNMAVDSLGQLLTLTVERLGQIQLAPAIIERLVTHGPGNAVGVNEVQTLVCLSGRSDAPVWNDSLPPAGVHDWWQQWWTSTNGTATMVPMERCRQATHDWSTRFFAARERRR